MSSIANPQPELPAGEELVAYLDGELPPEDCRRVEQRLAADPDYRQQLRDLDQAWEALDELPEAKADAEFARTTMELVTVAAQGDVSQHTAGAAATRRHRLRWLAAAGVAAVVIGFVAARASLRRGNEALLTDLPVIRKVDLLAHIEDVDFLRGLPTAVPLDQLITDKAAMDDELSHLAWASAESRSARREWIDALSSEEKARLASQAKRFENMPEEERKRLRELDREIAQAEDAADLQRNLLAYGQWLARLTPGEEEQLREELWELTADEQTSRVARFVRQANERASRRLSPEEAEKLRNEILAIAEQRKSAFLRDQRRRRGDDDRQPRQLDGPPVRVALVILIWELRNDDRDNQTRERLLNQLSPEARAHFDRLGREGRRRQLWQWIRDSLQPKLGPDELERFFADELDNNQRERLLNLPAAEMQAELERLYLAAQFGFRDADQWWTQFGQPGGRPDSPPRDWRSGPPPPEPFERDRRGRDRDGPRRDDRPNDRRPPDRLGPLPPPNGPPPPEDRSREAI